MKQRDRLYKIYKRNKDENINNQYKIYRNKIVTLITNLKQEYYKNLIEQNKNNSKKLWQTINNYNNIIKAKSHVIKEVLDENNYSVTDMNKIVEIFNKHYSTIGEKKAHTIRTNNDNIITEYEHGFYNNNSIFLRPVSEEEIKELISSLKNYTSPGFDNIYLKFTKTNIE